MVVYILSFIKPVVGSCEQGYEPSGSIKDGTFLDKLSGWQLPKKDFWS
jgi:hypothetical protein